MATTDNNAYLAPASHLPCKTAGDYPMEFLSNLKDTILFCEAIVREQGMELLISDQTRDGTGLSVVKVVVPGLRHFWARLAPGRLYDVPVRMGWLERPRTEEEMNPMALFL